MTAESCDQGPTSVRLPDSTIGQTFAQAVERFGERDVLVSRRQGVRLTYAQLDEHVSPCARALIASGIRGGSCRHLRPEPRRHAVRDCPYRRGAGHGQSLVPAVRAQLRARAIGPVAKIVGLIKDSVPEGPIAVPASPFDSSVPRSRTIRVPPKRIRRREVVSRSAIGQIQSGSIPRPRGRRHRGGTRGAAERPTGSCCMAQARRGLAVG